jgi:hypothetical protein
MVLFFLRDAVSEKKEGRGGGSNVVVLYERGAFVYEYIHDYESHPKVV